MSKGRMDGSMRVCIMLLMFPTFFAFGQTDSLPPVARDDSKSTFKDVNVTINVIENDSDPDSLGGIDPGTVDLDVSRSGIQDRMDTPDGKFTVNNSGVVTFDPKSDFLGAASNSYTVRDNAGKTSNSALITITVENPPNTSPVAVNDAAATNTGTAVTINVTANDTDSDGTINNGSVDLNPSVSGIQNSNNTPQGNFVVNATGVVTFTPAILFIGNASSTYTVNDNVGATSNVATITVTVTAVPNVAPVAVNDASTTTQNSPITVNVVTNDTDIDGTIDPATVDLNTTLAGIQNSNSTAQGSFVVNASGVVTYTPATGFSGTASLAYRVNDNDGATSNSATISIIVSVTPNVKPVAVNDAATTTEGNPVTINVLANDTDSDGTINEATVDLNTGQSGIQNSNSTAQGSFAASITGIVTYTPANDFSGNASLKYTVNDNDEATSNEATISVTVSADPNIAPIAVNDAATTNFNTAVTIDVTGNDTDSDGTINKGSVDLNTTQSGIQNSNSTTQGSFTASATGIVTYTPANNFSGNASLKYTVNDNEGATSNEATISVTVAAAPNKAPVAVNDAATTSFNTAVTIDVTGNDTDSDGTINKGSVDLNINQSGIQNSNSTTQGSFAASATGIVTYTPANNFSGNASLKYTVNDNDGATSNEATISVTVAAAPNKAPVAVNDAATTSFNTAVTIDVTGNDTDSDGTINKGSVDLNINQSGIQNSNSTTQGSFTASTTGIVTYTPVNNFSGNASLKYTVNDNDGATSNEATISVAVGVAPNKAPVAVNDAATTSFNTAVTIDVTVNDTDSDGTIDKESVDLNTNQSGIQNSNSTTQGSFKASTTGIVTYTPANDFSGNASLKYTVNDNDEATSNEATISVTVAAAPNKAPVAVNDAATTSFNTAVTIDVTVNDTDSDGTIDKESVDLNTNQNGIQNSNSTPQGIFSVNASGVVTFTPTTNFSGTASTKYSVNDNDAATSNAATVTITVNAADNVAPVAANDAATTNANTAVTVDVTANDTDNDGTINKATVDLNTSQAGIQTSLSTPQGNYAVNNVGVVTYTPLNNFTGTTSITYTVNDNDGLKSNNATINIRVNAVNTAPTAVADKVTTESNTIASISVLANDTDKDGTLDLASVDLNPTAGGLQKKVAVPQGIFEAIASGVVTYTPATNFVGVASISYTVKDNEGAVSNAAVITVEVSEVPVIGIDIPTGFTPNGDGANETWKIISKNASLIETPPANVKVFDKRGVLVYDASGFDKPWDGKHNGQSLPADSYYYIIDLRQGGKVYKGIVTILTNSP